MIYILLTILAILFFWILGVFSKPVTALGALVGAIIATVGSAMGNLQATLFGMGMLIFCSITFLIFNAGKW